MKEKTLALAIVILITTSIAGVVYAHWKGQVQIRVTAHIGSLTIRFIDPLKWSDNEATKDVGHINCYYTQEDPTEGCKKLIIEISNAYPNYAAHCNFTLKNIGTTNFTIINVTISDPNGELKWKWTIQYTKGFLWKDFNKNNVCNSGEEIIYITITDLVNLEFNPGQVKNAQIEAQITENAEESHSYSFKVSIEYEES